MKRILIMHGIVLALALGLSLPGTAGSPQKLGALTLLEVKPRILTPNGDGYNDQVFFVFDSSITGIPMETNVVDVNGANAGSLRLLDPPGTSLTWDGRDDNGNILPAGIYIYSIKVGKNQATGTVVVAR